MLENNYITIQYDLTFISLLVLCSLHKRMSLWKNMEVLVVEPKRERLSQRPVRRWEDIIKINLKEIRV